MAQKLNPLTLPLSQTNLIEASAGTGKTWNIAALFLRLILQTLPEKSQPLSVDKILVVTFTKAAAAELKTRLRDRLDGALNALKKTDNALNNPEKLRENCGDDDPFLFALLNEVLHAEANPETAQQRVQLRLNAAIHDFDNAAIYTIHSFCQRVLQDFAFLCNVPFDIQLDEENSQNNDFLIAAQDFWRERIAPNPDLAQLCYQQNNLSPETQIIDLHKFVGQPYLQLRPCDVAEDLAQCKQNLHNAWQNAQKTLPENETQFWATRDAVLHGTKVHKATFTKIFQELNQHIEKEISAHTLANLLHKDGENVFSYEFLSARTKEKKALTHEQWQPFAPLAQLHDAAIALQKCEQNALVQLNHDLLHHLRQSRQQQKQHSPNRQFDDLLLDVYHALLPESQYAPTLAQHIAHNWQVALIDEFQDTDPLQYHIFQMAFAQTQTPLFLVGDPKQAIYRFRGADIFAYLQAACDVNPQNRFTLANNFRTHSLLINSIGKLFARNNPFVLPEIEYGEIDAHRAESQLSPKGSALTIRWLNKLNDEKNNKDIIAKRAADYCANEIAQMLNDSEKGCLKNKNRPLRADEIAVLVRTHKEATRIQRALKKRGVQSVLSSRNNVFSEPEAQALAALLDFFIQPQRVAMLRFVLSGCLFDFTAEQIRELNQNENQLLYWIDSAQNAMQTWLKHGIYAAIQEFVQQHQVPSRLLKHNNERTLTNLYQLMELLAQEDENSHTPTSLRQWLGQHIAQNQEKHNTNNEEHTLRLESDEHLVKIVTMHKSKGLQYPIVFCPFAWDNGSSQQNHDWQIIHNQNATELLHKHQITENDKKIAEEEQLSESLRLMYVACTRAEEQLHIYMASHKYSSQNAFAYLLNAQEIAKSPEDYHKVWQDFVVENQSPQTDFCLTTDEPPRSHFMPTHHENQRAFQAAQFTPRRYRFVQHTSFTGLSKQLQRHATQSSQNIDNDDLLPSLDLAEHENENLNEINDVNVYTFSHGMKTGLCWHTILENINFSQPVNTQTDITDRSLQKYGFDPEIWRETTVNLMENTRKTPLLSQFSLSQMLPENRVMEWDFVLHAENFKVQDLRKWFTQTHLNLPENIVQAAQNIHFYDIHGFIKGFVDLLYHDNEKTLIVDYKSNFLGDTPTHYQTAELNAAMAEHHYYLQALIYAIAVARYLQTRNALPESIAVRYVFLRGVDGTAQQGVWAWDIATADLKQWL